MSKEKYYTPSLNEFHIGFRYEASREATLINEGKGNNWYSKSISSLQDFDTLGRYENLRVSYLDQTDIEDLGWSGYKRSICDWYYIKGFYQLKNQLKYSAFRLLHCRDRNTVKITGFEYEYQLNEETEGEDLFNGECKNYNELKNIMTLIGINNK